jgi:fibronectin type 3 domain-containing protein
LPPGSPMNLSAMPGNAQVVLTWAAPSNDGGAAISGYRVYRGNTSGGETLLITLGNVFTYTDTGLTNGQTYYYKVSAVNSIGEGSQSNEVPVTPATVPVSPFLTSVTPGDALAMLLWESPPSDGGSAVTAYKVYRGTTPGGETLLITLGNVLTYTDTGLTNGQTYYYKVSAVNSHGESVLTDELSATPTSPSTNGGDNTWLYIGIGVVAVLAGFGAAQLIMTRRKK